MARYPVQRQRFPFSARGRSCFCSSVNVAEVMIMPAVQKPHWKPGASRNCSLHRMQVLRCAEPFDRGDLASVGAERGRDAAVHGVAVQPHRARTAIACVATLFDAVPAQRADEGAQALPGSRLLVERLAVDGVRHAELLLLGADLFGEVLGQVLAVVGCAVRIVEPHVVADRVDAVLQCVGVGHGVEREPHRAGGACGDRQQEVVGVLALRRDHEDRRPAQVGQGEPPVGVALAQRADRDVDLAQQFARRRGCSRGCR